MAELASGAVSALLGVIRDEAWLLGGVKGNVQFIREEMESMNSFLAHLARTAPAGGEHDEQVRTWMNQVRLLAQDCNNCIDLYVYRGNPEIHRARAGGLVGLGRFLWWLPWFVRYTLARHDAAVQLRELRDRARDVGERRQRYGVEVPAKAAAAAALTSSSDAAGGGDGDVVDDGDGQLLVMATDHRSRPRALFETFTLEDFFTEKLDLWIREVEGRHLQETPVPSMAIAAADKDAVALESWHAVRSRFQVTVLVDVTVQHHFTQPLQPLDILYYILRNFSMSITEYFQTFHRNMFPRKPEPNASINSRLKIAMDTYLMKCRISKEKMEVVSEITRNVDEMKIDDKMEQIKLKIARMVDEQLILPEAQGSVQPLGVLLQALRLIELESTAAQQDQENEEAIGTLEWSPDSIIETTAKKLKDHMEKEAEGQQAARRILLHYTKYEHILQEVFLTSNMAPLHLQQALAEQHTAKVPQGRYDNKQAGAKQAGGPSQIPDTPMIEGIVDNLDKIRRKIKEQLAIKGIVDRIQDHLKHNRTLILLKTDRRTDMSRWEETRDALYMLDCIAGVLIVTTTIPQQAREYCYPQREPIDYSHGGLYYDTLLQFTGQQMNQDNNYDPQLFRDILDECKTCEFSMKLFAHTLYANPKRSNEELRRLHSSLKLSPITLDSTATKMLKFSYSDLPRDYRSCILYLAIFPREFIIKRSTLIGRWVAEGLITKEDWPASVHRAERCFEALIDRWLLYAADIGATGKVKSCVIGAEVHGFITKMARKQHIVETRLSHHLARHFSIFNELLLRGSDRIEDFFRKLSKSSQLSLLKVLDLEGCHCFGGKNQRFLKDICNKILLLKYLSLRGTDITQLPNEINKLHELEVLDIRQTKVPASATKHILLLKLKRLLAGNNDPNPSSTDSGMAVQVPRMIEKMLSMEVLSNVKPRSSQDLKDIGMLWQLRKLGVVIEKDAQLISLVGAISNLHECLRSLSITLPITSCEGTISSRESLTTDIQYPLAYPPKLLENLHIHGRTTNKVPFFPLLAKDGDYLVKVTLSRVLLNQDDLNVLAKLPVLRCVRLQHVVCAEKKLTFKKDEFQPLKYFLVEGSNISVISFEDGTAPELEKIVLSFTGYLKAISGVDHHHPKLKELELINNGRLLSLFDNAKQVAKVTLRGTLLKQGDLQVLAKKPNLRCLVLLDKSYDKSQLILNHGEFPKLNLLVVDCSVITNISFTRGSAPNLEKIIWSFTKMESLSGIEHLTKLKVLEINGDHVPNEVKEAIKRHTNRPGSNYI